MDDPGELAQRFEDSRAHLRGVAYRMLGSASEADDAVQEVWLRLSRTDADAIENLGGWLTTVLARVCLDMLRVRKARREESVGAHLPDSIPASAESGPLAERLLADSIGAALLLVLETLEPAERLAFVLHDMFAISFDEIAPIVGRSSTAARQLASRARRRVQRAAANSETDRAQQHAIVDAFLTASRTGDFAALLAVLDPDVVMHADPTVVTFGTAPETRGAAGVAKHFSGRAAAARVVLIDGFPNAAWIVRGRPKVVFDITVSSGKIVRIDLLGDAEALADLDLDLQV